MIPFHSNLFFYRDPNKVNAKICDHFADPKLSNVPLDDENENTDVSTQAVFQHIIYIF